MKKVPSETPKSLLAKKTYFTETKEIRDLAWNPHTIFSCFFRLLLMKLPLINFFWLHNKTGMQISFFGSSEENQPKN